MREMLNRDYGTTKPQRSNDKQALVEQASDGVSVGRPAQPVDLPSTTKEARVCRKAQTVVKPLSEILV